jgi:hypothetical protein
MNEIDREFWWAVVGLTLVGLMAVGILGLLVWRFWTFSASVGGV